MCRVKISWHSEEHTRYRDANAPATLPDFSLPIADNDIHDNADAGIAFLESFGAKVYNNKIKNCKYGIRLSLGSGDNEIKNNTFDNLDKYGLYTYEGSDEPDVSNGRPSDNVFDGNTVSNVKIGVQVKEGDDNVFKSET